MNKQDIPLTIAIPALAVLLGALFVLQNPHAAGEAYRAVTMLIEQEQVLITVQFFVVFGNLLFIFFLLPLDLKKRNLKAQLNRKSQFRRKDFLKALLICLTIAMLNFYFLPRLAVDSSIESEAYARALQVLNYIAKLNFSVSAFFLSFFILRLKNFKSDTSLAKIKPFSNEIVVGAVGEESQNPAWISVGQRSLNGNILITGSIGSGKTQGTILPYLKQLLENTEPHPAVLCIDPKGTFTKDALEMVRSLKLENKVVHLKLGGSETFNPIFTPDSLRNARFLQTAQMLRAAASNFSKGHTGNDFWEISSFNLLKNCLVHLAVTRTYYTLNDLYRSVLSASTSEPSQDLVSASKTENLDLEIKSNIESAAVYFEQEFSTFEDKVKTSIVATATSFLNQFQEYQASKIFCPREEDLTIRSMHDAISESKIILFDITEPGLSKAMGTFVKLSFEQAVLDRLKSRFDKKIPAVMIVDEYQDVVSVGSGGSLGDDKFLAKCREGNAMVIAATQSLTSLENALGSASAAREIFQNFRTRIACHSSDGLTIKTFQELIGEFDREKLTESFSRHSPDASLSQLTGAIDSRKTNLSESVSLSTVKEFTVTGKHFSSLRAFEAFAIVFDGIETQFAKIFLKPYFLTDKTTSHKKVLDILRDSEKRVALTISALLMSCLMFTSPGHAGIFPNLCDVVKSTDFLSNMEFNISGCTCGWPPHPCTQISYYAPETFIEVVANPKESEFKNLPGAALQLNTLGMASRRPFGAEGELDTHSFHAHVLTVPFFSAFSSAMPCGSSVTERGCFEAMSEHLGSLWSTGSADLLQPQFLLFAASPKACLLLGAAKSPIGGEYNFHPSNSQCSTPRNFMPHFPPSTHSACTGWGPFFPRAGTYEGPSQTIGSLMIAARIKSLASEVFLGTPTSPDEKWQMIKPNSSAGFREGETAAFIETFKRGNEWGRLAGGKPKNFLYVIWRRQSCCKEFTDSIAAKAAIVGMKAVCSAGGFR